MTTTKLACTWNLSESDQARFSECGATAIARGGGGAAPEFALCAKHLAEATAAGEEAFDYDMIDGAACAWCRAPIEGEGFPIFDTNHRLVANYCSRLCQQKSDDMVRE